MARVAELIDDQRTSSNTSMVDMIRRLIAKSLMRPHGVVERKVLRQANCQLSRVGVVRWAASTPGCGHGRKRTSSAYLTVLGKACAGSRATSASRRLATEVSGTRLVYVVDCETDLMPLMVRAQELGTPADWLIRASHNRCMPDSEKLWQHTTAGTSMGEIAFTMTSRHGVKARAVLQQMWVERVALPASKGKTVAANCLVAREVGARPAPNRLNGVC